ncbi:MAG TPA: alanine racemase [Dehalococcoidia bacterium]|nr:alanine racemase [Dehalococcoidia bacterium]
MSEQVAPERAIIGQPPALWRGRPVWAEIHLDQLSENVRLLADRVHPARLMAVVKANAYGHGAAPVAQAALEAGASYLGVVCVDEGVQLRAAGIEAPIVVLGYTPVEQAEAVIENRLTPVVNSRQFALALSALASQFGVRCPVHVKVDTGMARFGCSPAEAVDLAEWLRELPSIDVEGICTHFASADEEDKAFTQAQYERFLATTERLPWIPIRHAGATAVALDLPEMVLDMVRVGLGLYGYAPGETAPPVPIRPALALRSRIARIHTLEPGETVSYGRTWRAERRTRVGLVMIGYGDGLPRLLSNRGEVLIRGRRASIIGRVCMDMTMVDLTDIPEAQLEDEVTIIGAQGAERIGAQDLAVLCGTISYEILTGISARVPRLYLRGGRVVHAESLVATATTSYAGSSAAVPSTDPSPPR